MEKYENIALVTSEVSNTILYTHYHEDQISRRMSILDLVLDRKCMDGNSKYNDS